MILVVPCADDCLGWLGKTVVVVLCVNNGFDWTGRMHVIFDRRPSSEDKWMEYSMATSLTCSRPNSKRFPFTTGLTVPPLKIIVTGCHRGLLKPMRSHFTFVSIEQLQVTTLMS